MEGKQAGLRTFINTGAILIALLLLVGSLTYLVPSGRFDVDTRTFTPIDQVGIGLWAWVFSPLLVLLGDAGALIIGIIIFLLLIGGALHVLKVTGLIEGLIVSIAKRFARREGLLLGALVLAFMSLGAFVGVFEEVVPLVPMVILLARGMGWDTLTGLGVSVLAAGLGFAAAVTNPFTIGVAQELAGVPLFSGALLRFIVFLSVYAMLMFYLRRHIARTRSVERVLSLTNESVLPKAAYAYFVACMAVMMVVVAASPAVPLLRDLSLLVIALIFLLAAVGVGLLAGKGLSFVGRQYLIGAWGMAPAIVLILLASSIRQVMTEGRLLDWILYRASENIGQFAPFTALLAVFLLVLFLNFFIGSGSAKAFILMPIIVPTMDFLGMGRQLGILAFQFGDGFSNVLYPTNAVLLISLGLAGISYAKWFRFIWPLQLGLFALSIFWMWVGYTLGYGL
ncbi:MAG: hypothetical protein DDT34_00806 [Firmicutes bacterium]|nr:hypothetical protein [Bacillota bacterium]